MENSSSQLFLALSFHFLQYDSNSLKQSVIKILKLTDKAQLITGAQESSMILGRCGQVNHNHKIQTAV